MVLVLLCLAALAPVFGPCRVPPGGSLYLVHESQPVLEAPACRVFEAFSANHGAVHLAFPDGTCFPLLRPRTADDATWVDLMAADIAAQSLVRACRCDDIYVLWIGPHPPSCGPGLS